MPAAAIIGAAVVGAGASAYASSKASSAAKKAANAQQQSADAATAEQARQFDYIQQQNEPFRQVGLSATQALASGFGLPVSMTTPAANTGVGGKGSGGYAVSPVAPNTGVSMTAPAGTDLVRNTDGSTSYTPHAGGVSMTSQQAQAILADRPDVAGSSWLNGIDPSVIGDRTGDGKVTQEDRAAYWQDNYGTPEGYKPPAVSAPTPATPASTTPAGYTDPTAPNGYTMTARPTVSQYVAPALDVGLSAYQKSPGYDFRLSEGQKALDHVAAAGGGLMSGARVKAAQRYGQDYATADYTDWRNYTTNQYNTNRAFDYNANQNVIARSDGLYQDDRGYLTSRYDQRNGQLMQLAGFGTAANASNAGAAQSFATNVGNNLMTAGQAKANGYINSANATTSAVNNGLTIGANLAGRYMTSGYGSNGGYGGYGGGGVGWTADQGA